MKSILIPVFTLLLSQCVCGQSQVNNSKTADSLYQHGLALLKQGKNAESAEVLRQALSVAPLFTHADSITYGNILHFLGTGYFTLARKEEAYLLLSQALDFRQATSGVDDLEFAKTLNNLAAVCLGMEKLDEAEVRINQALVIKAKNPGKDVGLEYSKSQLYLTQILLQKGLYERADSVAEDYTERRRNIAGETSYHYATALSLWAGVKTRRFQLEEAKAKYEKALAIAKIEKGESSGEYLLIYLNIGQIYARLGQHAEAEKHQRACVAISEKLMGKKSEPYALSTANLGFVLMHQGRFREALPVLEDARIWNEAWHGALHSETLRVMGNLATAHYYLGDLTRAKMLYDTIMQNIQQSERRDEEYFNALINQSRLLIDEGDYETAERLLLKAEKEYAQTAPLKLKGLHSNLGVLYMNLDSFDLAEKKFKQALQFIKSPTTAFSIYDIGVYSELVWLYHLDHNRDSALHYADEAMHYLETRLPKDIAWLSESELYDVAAFAFSRNNRFFELAALWNDPKMNEICFDYQLFIKNFVLDRAISMRRNFENKAQTQPAEWLEWKITHRSLTDQLTQDTPDEKRINDLRNQLNALEKHLFADIPTPPVPHWKQIQSALKNSEACLEFARYADETGAYHYAALLLRANDQAPVFVNLGPETIFESLLKEDTFQFSRYYGEKGLTKLYDFLIAPLTPYLKGIKTIFCAPAGLLHHVNFSAVTTPQGNIAGNKFHFRIVQNMRHIIDRPNEKYFPPKKALILGDINYGSVRPFAISQQINDSTFERDWQKILHSKPEIQSAERLLGAAGAQVVVLTDTFANETRLRSFCSDENTWDCLHLSTHGIHRPALSVQDPLNFGSNWLPLWRENPLERVAIVLANANSDTREEASGDGVMTGLEISQLNLSRNYLTVISACGSANGRIDSYEGVWGLGRAFRLAGSRHVILTLWDTRDESASFFMNAFYRNWLSKKMSVPDAFKAAQNETMANDSDPRYWAGFILLE